MVYSLFSNVWNLDGDRLLWFATIGAFLWYVSLPIDETVVEQEVDGNANALVGVGNYNGNSSESYKETESEPQA